MAVLSHAARLSKKWVLGIVVAVALEITNAIIWNVVDKQLNQGDSKMLRLLQWLGLNWFGVMGWGLLLVLLIAVIAAYRRETPTRAEALEFFENRHGLNKSTSSLPAEIEAASDVFAIWPAGGAARNMSSDAFKKMRRLIVSSPKVAGDILTYIKRFDVNGDVAHVQHAIFDVTRLAKAQGVDVRWHDAPLMSIVINRSTQNGWARYEMLLPHLEPMRRPSLRIYQATSPVAFQAIEDTFDRMWEESVPAD